VTTGQPPRRNGADRTRLVLTVAEAAHVLGISRALAYELVARGELPALSLGRRKVIPRRALEALIDNVTVTTAGDDAALVPNDAPASHGSRPTRR
jgi:excisionase family DNA binding protein